MGEQIIQNERDERNAETWKFESKRLRKRLGLATPHNKIESNEMLYLQYCHGENIARNKILQLL
jgi:hypothetical protein